MMQHLVHVHSTVRVTVQQIHYEHLGLLAHGRGARKADLWQLGFALAGHHHLLDVAFKRRLAEQNLEGHDAQAPRIDLISIALFRELFRR
jgi:hypothetical protein